jgi:hypothetical protein
MMNTIAQLRRSGYKVRVLHSRPKMSIQKIGGVMTEYNPKGGNTIIEITTPDGRNAIGSSECSDKDSWNRRLGNQIALGRAMENLRVQI